jgi:hypothetical protein
MRVDDGPLSGDLPNNVAKVWAVHNFHVRVACDTYTEFVQKRLVYPRSLQRRRRAISHVDGASQHQ